MTVLSALVADIAVAILLAPVVAVLVPLTRRAVSLAFGTFLLWLLVSFAFVATSVNTPLTSALAAHVVFLTALLAAAAVGLALRRVFHDPLDAVAVGAGLAAMFSLGVFVIGRLAGDLPLPFLNAVLAANPIIATTAAVHVDLFRTELLYRISPVPHGLFRYPDWPISSVIFAATAAIAWATAGWQQRRGRMVRA